MTREKMKEKIKAIIGYDYSGDLEAAAEAIVRLWEFGYTWEVK